MAAVATAVAAVLVPAAVAMACVGLASLVVDGSPRVEPGDTVTVTARSFARDVPVDIRLNTLTGRPLVSVEGPDSTMNSSVTIDVPLPDDMSEGPHVLLASQDHHDMNVGQPARALLYVGAAPPARPYPADRPEALAESTGPSLTTLALIAAGAAVGGLVLTGVGSWAVARGRS